MDETVQKAGVPGTPVSVVVKERKSRSGCYLAQSSKHIQVSIPQAE